MKNRILEVKQAVDNPEELDIYYYGYIAGDSYDWWSGEIIQSSTSADFLQKELEAHPGVRVINLYVNSNGGEVMEAMAIRNQLKRHPAFVTAYVDGFACSAASFILTGCDKVVMYSNTMQMLHDMWTSACGNYRELRKTADDLEKISIGNRAAYVEKSGGKLTEAQVAEILANESWLTAKECLDYGLCDEIVEEIKDLQKAKEMLQQFNKTIEQQISYTKALVAAKAEIEKVPATKEPITTNEPEQSKKISFADVLEKMGGKK